MMLNIWSLGELQSWLIISCGFSPASGPIANMKMISAALICSYHRIYCQLCLIQEDNNNL